MASMTARGAYGEADVKALETLMAWIGENGYEAAGAPRIVYMHNPSIEHFGSNLFRGPWVPGVSTPDPDVAVSAIRLRGVVRPLYVQLPLPTLMEVKKRLTRPKNVHFVVREPIKTYGSLGAALDVIERHRLEGWANVVLFGSNDPFHVKENAETWSSRGYAIS